MGASKRSLNSFSKPNIVGQAYQELKTYVERYAEKKLSVLFVGESGCGKELFARHYMDTFEKASRKAECLTVNCAAFTEALLFSEVFGHVRGAFTGASGDRDGLIETCAGGVLFLDELGDASEQFQAAILRVSEGNSFRRVGSNDEIECSAVLIAATNKPDKIRNDLKQRFHLLPIPPLQRLDIPELATHFVREIFEDKKVYLKKDLVEELMAREYPGNIRQLKRIIEEFAIEKGDDILTKRRPVIELVFNFNYSRFRREITVWDKYLGPLIQQYYPEGPKYRYMDWDPSWMDPEGEDHRLDKSQPSLRLVHGAEEHGRDLLKERETYVHGTLDLIEWLRAGAHDEKTLFALPHPSKLLEVDVHQEVDSEDERVPTTMTQPKIAPEEVVPLFRLHMRKYFEKEILPYLLEELYRKYECVSVRQISPKKPALTPLLDLPPKEAKKKFELVYYEYHLQRNANDMEETAKALGLSKKALKGRIYRAQKNL